MTNWEEKFVNSRRWFWAAVILLLSGILYLGASPAAEVDPSADVPHLPPVSATAFACDFGAKRQVVAMVVSYSNGQVLRWDAAHMHGFTVAQLIAYHDTAPDSRLYIVPCKSPEIT